MAASSGRTDASEIAIADVARLLRELADLDVRREQVKARLDAYRRPCSICACRLLPGEACSCCEAHRMCRELPVFWCRSLA